MVPLSLACKIKKMKKSAFIILMALVSFSAAAQKKKTATPMADIGDITSVSIYHTACFGRCAEYKVEVNKNGIATYTGIRFVPDSGIYVKNIGAKTAREILTYFARYSWDSFPDRYESMVQDLPGLILTVNHGKQTKSIQNAHFGPIVLKGLCKKLDVIINRQNDENGLVPIDRSWRRIGNYKYE